ncbi:MAG: phosphate transport system permease protein [Psychromonas sp.]|jgi:phosphate transport system permease protein|uniref:phosphate ABC transporter permease PstA n=1 Tax=Psychromonas sp. TaxID=1884585 RepID=UPI0039E30DB6
MTNQLQPSKEPLNINDATMHSNMHSNTERIKQSLKKRNRKEKRFRLLGRLAISFGFMMVVILFADIGTKAYPAFFQHWIKVDIEFNRQWLNIEPSNQSEQALKQANYSTTVKKSLYQMFPSITARGDKRDLVKLLSYSAEFKIEEMVNANPDLLGQTVSMWLLADDDVDSYFKGEFTAGQSSGRINSKQAMWLKQLFESGAVEKRFNTLFFTNSDSREPELAGIRGALSGTILTMIIVLLISFPIGVSAALYLEEFAPKNRWTDIIEVNINNLAAVPSIVFGLLGLAVLINIFGLPRSASLVGGIVLSLMTLPTIIIASRASIKAVPNSIREAAIGLGASDMQVTLGHVLPMAMPGILTGTIIGLAQALGETAPLLMIGMVAFIVDVPGNFTDAATVMPVQIYLWADSPESAFLAKTSAAILVLLAFLLIMNFSATYVRSKFEKNGK